MTLRHSIKSVTGLFIWLGFAIVFFYAGLFFTEWLLGDESFRGGWRWIMVIAFPFLIPGFFLVNRRYGCAGGFCRVSAQPDRDSVQRLPPA